MIEVKVKNILFYAPARGYTLLLQPVKGPEGALPVVVGQFEAQAIAMALEEVKLPRPMTHDLLTGVLDHLTDGLERVEISDLQGGTFFAKLIVKTGTRIDEVDARPSDAIAIAIRSKASIFVSEEVFSEAAVELPTESAEEESVDRSLSQNLNRITERARQRFDLERDLAEAIQQEDYEEAARLRDELDLLENDK